MVGYLRRLSMETKKQKSILGRTAFVLILIFVSSTAYALNFYTGDVLKVTTRTDGDIVVILKNTQPVGNSAAAPNDGFSRYLIDGAQPGAKLQLATVLSALALGVQLEVATVNAASFDPQVPFQFVVVAN